jgi:hypothetical protein
MAAVLSRRKFFTRENIPARFGLHNQFDRHEKKRHSPGMSTQEIIAELPKLNRGELEQVNLKLHELLASGVAPRATGQRLKQFAGAVRGLPSDMARNHDHYLHGRPKK